MKHPEFHEEYFNPDAELPYGVKAEEVKTAVKEFYEFYIELNEFFLEEGYGRLETIIRANNALSDFIGNVATVELAKASDSIIHNQKNDGFPDLLPLDNEEYAEQNYEVHHGKHGIETKCSKSNGGWQAHNNEESRFIIFRYERGDPEDDAEDMAPIQFTQILCGNLTEDDWSHSPRSEGSRRTITSSIIKTGMHKLRSNPIYENPDAITGMGDKLQQYYENHAQFNSKFAEDNPEYVTEQTNLSEIA